MMDLNMLRNEYDLSRRYSQSLYDDLSEADIQWRPRPKSSAIGWHLGHQAAVNHYMIRNLLDAEASLDPQLDARFDSANPEEKRGELPSLAVILAYRDTIAQRTHARIDAILAGERPATQQLLQAVVPILVSIINHEYQHDCWIREMRTALGHDQADSVFSTQVAQLSGYWVLRLG
ncbi:MAG: DinB family protein [bacterium]|nr:DinB family protein [bacterium]